MRRHGTWSPILIRGIWALLLVVAGVVSLLHAVQHDDPEPHCSVCLHAQIGLPALLRQSVPIAPPATHGPVLVPDAPRLQHAGHGSSQLDRGPPARSLA